MWGKLLPTVQGVIKLGNVPKSAWNEGFGYVLYVRIFGNIMRSKIFLAFFFRNEISVSRVEMDDSSAYFFTVDL
jgi:hypothetical protein